MKRSRLLLVAVLAALWASPSAALAQASDAEDSEVKIAEVNAARYDEGGQVTMVVAFRNLTSPLDPAQLAITADGQPVGDLVVERLAESAVPQGVVLAIDTSGSMEGEPMASAKAAARAFIEQKRPEDRIAVVAFAQEVTVPSGFSTDQEALLERIDGLEPAGGTAFNDGVMTSIGLFGQGEAVNLSPNIVVLTDGDDTTSGTSAEDMLAAVTESEARVFGIALETPEFTPATVEAVAAAGDGLFLSTPQPSQLVNLYGQIQAEINNVLVARFTVDRPTPGELELAVGYGELSAATTEGVSGFVVEGSAAGETQATFPPPEVRVIQSSLPAHPSVLIAVGALGMGLAIALFIWILFGQKEGGTRLEKRLTQYGRKAGGQAAESRTLLDRLPLLRRFSQRAEEEVRRRGLLSAVNATLEQANIPLAPGEAVLAGFGLAVIGGLMAAIFYGPAGGGVVFVFLTLAVFVLIRWAGSREKRRFEKQLPDTLTLLSTSLRAGYSLLQAVEAVAAEAPDPTAREFGRAIAEARLGRSVSQSLNGITERTQSQDFEWAVMAIDIQREVGGNLAEVLQTVAETMLSRNRLRGEIRALTAEGRISAIVLGSLPFFLAFFLWTSNPEYLMPLFESTFGLIAIGVGLLLMAGGILWLRKIVNIDV